MTINSMSTPFAVANIFESITVQRDTRATAEVSEQAGSWAWPLPVNSVLAVFDDRAMALSAVEALAQQGAGATWMASGEDGARRLRQSFARRGALARWRSHLDGEDETAGHLQEWCARGATALLMQPPREQVQDVMRALAEHGARFQRRTGRWTWEWTAGRA